MKLVNYTNVPDALLREMIRHATPPGVANYDITFKNDGDGHLHGWAYTCGTGYHVRNGRCPPLITIHVPKWYCEKPGVHHGAHYTENRRHVWSRMRRSQMGYMAHEQFSNHEALLHIIAHELRHLWQRKVKKGRRVWGGRGRMSERDADAYGIRMVRSWRRERPDPVKTVLPLP